MEIGIPVEIQGKYGEYYPGFVYGLQSLQTFCVRIFGTNPNSQPVELCVPPTVLRPPADGRTHSNINPQDLLIGQEVDILIGGKRSDVPSQPGTLTSTHRIFSSWWTGSVSKVRGDFVVVNLNAEDLGNINSNGKIGTLPDGRLDIPLSHPIEKTEIVEKDQLRVRNLQPNLTTKSFFTHVIDVPDCLVEYFHDPVNFQPLALKCGFPVLVCPAPDGLLSNKQSKLDGETYDKGHRLIVVSTQSVCIERASLIEKEFIKMSRRKMLLKKQIEENSERLKSHFVEEFAVHKSLLSQAIGIHSCNIQRALTVPGVLTIDVDRDSCLFRITGKTRESVKQARGLLDYAVEVMQVPKIYVPSLVGHNNRNIQALVDRVGLGRMGVASASEATVPDCIPFRFTGTRQAIKDARLFVEFNIVSLREIDRIRGHPVPPLRNLILQAKEIAADREQSLLSNPDETSNCPEVRGQSGLTTGENLQRRGRQRPLTQYQSHYQEERTNGTVSDTNGATHGSADSTLPECNAGGAGDGSTNHTGASRRKKGARRGGYGSGNTAYGNSNNSALSGNEDQASLPRKFNPSTADNIGSRQRYQNNEAFDNVSCPRTNGHVSDQRSEELATTTKGRSSQGGAVRPKRPNNRGPPGAVFNENAKSSFLTPN